VPNLVDQVWGAERPERPLNEVKVHSVEFAGQSVNDKYDKIAEKLNDVDFLLVTALDEICWILNLRGSDI